MSLSCFKFVFFIPKESRRRVLDHLFGKFPEKLGQFMSKPSANPTIGEIGQLVFVEEDRVELVVNDKGKHEELKRAITELKNVHPYEEVAYDVYKLENF